MAQMKNTKKTGAGKGRGGEVGAPTTYRYGKSGGKRVNMTPPKAGEKSPY